MNEIHHYLKFENLSKNWKKYVFHWDCFLLEKWNLEPIGNSTYNAKYLALVSPKQTTGEMKALQALDLDMMTR